MSKRKKLKFKAAFLAGLMIGSIVLSFMAFIIFGESMVHTVLNNNKKEYEQAQEDYTVKTRPIYDLQYKEEVASLPSMQVLNSTLGYEEAAVIAALNQILGAFTPEKLKEFLGVKEMFRADTVYHILTGAISGELKFGVRASFTCAQGCYELGWDKSRLTGKKPGTFDIKNAYGIKVGSGKVNDYWFGKGKNLNTLEYYDGNAKAERHAFRVYDSFWHSGMDHGRMLSQEPWYTKHNVVGQQTAYDFAYRAGKGGYFTQKPGKYRSSIASIYKRTNLEKIDLLVQQVKEVLARQGGGVVTPNGTQVPSGEWAPQNSMGGIQIANTNRITKNYTKGNNRKIEYIVIHDTGNTEFGAKAPQNFNYFNTNSRGASAHYIVDDRQIWQAVDDKDIAHHCGDPKSGNYDRSINCSNRNSIGIEMCVDEKSMLKTTIQKTLYLTKQLMYKYNIPLNRVIRHHDVSGKTCPAQFKGDDGKWTLWWKFKRDLAYITGNGSGSGTVGGSGPIYNGGSTGVAGGGGSSNTGFGGGTPGSTGGSGGEVVQQTGGKGIVVTGAGRNVMIQNGINYDNLQPARKALLDWAVMQLGKPYKWGAVGPNSFDCSGYTSFVYRNALHIEIPRTSGAQRDFKGFKKIDESQAQPGDIVWHTSHVMLYLKPSGTPGYPWVMESPGTGKKVRIYQLKKGGKHNHFRQLK